MSNMEDINVNDEKGDIAEHVEASPADIEALKSRHRDQRADDAAALIDEAGGQFEISSADRKRVLRKIDFWVCVPLCIVYTIQSLDKGSINYASVFNFQTDANLVGSQYSWLSSCVTRQCLDSRPGADTLLSSSSKPCRVTLWSCARSSTGSCST